ncbi:Regulator of G- signaling 3, partial [Brachionus plicatilis]
ATFFEESESTNKCCSSIKPNEYVVCSRECCRIGKMVKCESGADTGYETLSRYNESSEKMTQSNGPTMQSNLSITTVTNTTNSYSQCDLTFGSTSKPKVQLKSTMNYESMKMDKFDQIRTQLIGNLIEIEANFVSFLSMSVATFSRPLRGFFIQQQDYFTLFQNVEKILVISENFLRSMDKWSAYDLYTKIGQLYTQKMSLFKEAFTTYVKGYPKAKELLNDLVLHSKQFRLFLNETQ